MSMIYAMIKNDDLISIFPNVEIVWECFYQWLWQTLGLPVNFFKNLGIN